MRGAALLFSLLATLPALAQDWWFFENRRYYEPLIAGVREPHVSALALGYGDKVRFQVSDRSPRRIWDIDLGAELPILGRASSDVVDLPAGKWGIGLWIPIDFHMTSDFGDNSGPIVNTDYRFGGMIKVRYGLRNDRWLAARLHVGHESTHLGDEFSIVGQRRFPREFERINVSWEFADLGFMLDAGSWNARAGGTFNLRGSYYETSRESVTFSPLGPVIPSKERLDLYGGLEGTWEEAFSVKRTRWDVYASTEVRRRSVYDYHRPHRDVQEERQYSVNVIVGTKVNGAGRGLAGRASPFVRWYRGVNPHGQFRDHRGYTEYGIGIRLVR